MTRASVSHSGETHFAVPPSGEPHFSVSPSGETHFAVPPSGETLKKSSWRFPAEWEASDAVVLAWPHVGTDWAPWLSAVEQTYIALARAILARAKLVLLVKNKTLEARALRLIDRQDELTNARLQCTRYDYDDTWLRDTGPITLVSGSGFRWLDFSFTGWGGKYGASKDDKIVAHLARLAAFKQVEHVPVPFALEGGAIESDGAGTLLSTWNCLSKRHPGKTRLEIEQTLQSTLHVNRVLWLEHGELDGDDTDAHIDTLARFASPECIVYQGCEDATDPHFASLQAMAAEIAGLRRANGQPYQCIALPWAPTLATSSGRRLAASYANYLILNGAILMPGYGVETDIAASMRLSAVFPQHEIVVVPCRALIEQNGSLHCVTMQLPAGTLAS
jgi:agmatine/peptidylarginine deiminase